jgi:diguanylate cyclase (GGDEF)-like protein
LGVHASRTSPDAGTLARLHAGLLELASVVATADHSELMDAIARTISEALDWGAVVINVYRPAWDDYEVQSVHGSEAAGEALLGEATPWETWVPLMAERFERRGAFLVRDGDFDWDSDRGVSHVPPGVALGDPDAWHPGDALFVPLHDENGRVSGVLSVDEPVSGRLPTDDEIDALVAVAAHAGVALRHARETVDLRRHRAALKRFHEIFSRSRGSASALELLDAVADGMRYTLGFERVEVELLEPPGRDAAVTQLLVARYEREGCYLLTAAEAAEVAPAVDLGPPSERSGRGPAAWQDHRLLIPLRATSGELLAVMHVGEPRDRLLPGTDLLQALRVIGDQAASHLEAANRLRELRYLADHDPLTGLGNRRAFMDLLEAETARAARYDSRFTLALCDIDAFKELNDVHGHPAGDEALRRTARVMESSVRRSDGAFRIGGDEFALVLVEASTEATREIVDRIETSLGTPERAGEPIIRVSVGAISSDEAEGAEALLRRADEAMYQVKRARRAV